MKRDDAIEWLKRTTGPDEDVYPLVARDMFAAAIVLAHAVCMERAGVRPNKVDEAYACAERMRTFPDRKIPD